MKNNAKLIEEHKKLIVYEAGKYSKMVPYDVVLAEAYRLANKAADSYDPKQGAKFSTHLTNQLKKLSRISTTYGSTVRLPENKQFKLQHINAAELELKDQLGRAPSALELSEFTRIPMAQINQIKQGRSGEVNISSLVHTPVFINNTNDDWLHFVYHDLTDIDRIIFEHKTGFNGKKSLSNEELAKKLNMSPSAVNNRTKMIAEKIHSHWVEDV
jgi:DNA-directed RNA polymerase specialized sigma subunit